MVALAPSSHPRFFARIMSCTGLSAHLYDHVYVYAVLREYSFFSRLLRIPSTFSSGFSSSSELTLNYED